MSANETPNLSPRPEADLVLSARADEARLDTPEAIEDFALQDDYALNPDYIELVVDAADRGDGLRLRELLDALHPADVADLMGFLSADYREQVIPWIPADALAEILPELDDAIREEVVEQVAPDALAEVLQELDSDDAATVLGDLEEDQKARVLAHMPESERAAIQTTLAYEEETAGRLMQREVVAAPQFWTVGQVIDHMRAQAEDLPELFFDIYVVDPMFRPVGAVAVSQVMRTRRDVPLTDLMEPVTEVGVDSDQEEVAYIFEKYHMISVPVVDAGGRLVGQITVDDIVNIIQAENREDILALAGVSDEGRDSTTLDVMRSRLPWLGVNLITALLASTVIALFQNEISQLVALAVLMPIVASMGGNAGTQALTVSVRALATRELTAANALRTVWREIRVGLLNGAVFALLLSGVTYFWFKSAGLALVIAAAVLLNLTAAALAGTLVPLGLSRVGRDPAVSSPVFVTTVTDVVGFFTFLGLAALILM
ncbi:MAG: magnesium transporter [Asticcacaulis sp.]